MKKTWEPSRRVNANVYSCSLEERLEQRLDDCMIVDFHNHFYPQSYMDELKRGKGYASLKTDAQGRLLIEYIGDYNVVESSHINLEERLKAMDKVGIDLQVLSLTTPGVERETAERGIRLARATNDEFGNITEKYFDRFTDSVCYDADVLMSTYSFSGAEKIMLGTDFPHQIHDLDHSTERIRRLRIDEIEKKMILGENAVRLLKL